MPRITDTYREARARDAALDLLKQHRARLIERAFDIAVSIAKTEGRVTSPEVLACMRDDPDLRVEVASKDKRFMGPVFRRKCWKHVGWSDTGSHTRPVKVWSLRGYEKVVRRGVR